MRTVVLFVVAAACLATPIAHAQRDRGSWKKTLHAKAMQFEKNAAERHNIVGSYPSSVRLLPPKHYAGSQKGAWKQIVETGALPPGWTFDHGTTGLSNVAHTSSWTGCLLTSQAFRVAFLRKRFGEQSDAYRDAYARASEIIQSLRILTLVSGQPGFLARGVALGHGVSYEERGGAGTRDLWAQGAGELSYLRYRGGPSHHNYDHVFRGLGIYYFVAADEHQKAKIRAIVVDMSHWAHLRNDMVVMHPDGKRESTMLIGGWRGLGGSDRPSGGSVMALTGLKIAQQVTGNARVGRLYNEWVGKLGLRDPEKTKASIMGRPRGNYDDTDHLLGDLYLLNLIEEDPQLRAYYRKCVRDSWDAHKTEKMAWFNCVYRAVLGDDYGDPTGSLWNLQTHPTCRVFQPQMNSIRTDLEFFDGSRGQESLHPLPVYQRASDNEYEWKGSPYRLDGWQSWTVSVLEVSPHDPYVQFASDTAGNAYWSNTQGEVWHKIDGLPGANDFVFSAEHPWIAFAATNQGVYRTLDGGASWHRTHAAATERLTFDPDHDDVLYAVGTGGVYKSAAMGEREMGTAWRAIGGQAPGGAVFAVDPRGDRARLYMLTRSGFFAKSEDEAEWTKLPQPSRTRGFSTVDAIGGEPLWVRVDPHDPERLFRAVRTRGRRRSGPSVSVSDDGGRTWSPVLRALRALTDWSTGRKDAQPMTRDEMRRLFTRMRQLRMSDLRVDRRDADTWYGQLEDGVAVTHDGGKTWQVRREGLDIPRVSALWTPRHADLVMVGTPAGMYVSRDQAETWSDTSLILQESGAIRSEIGGIGYLTAYWMGRYHGFITDEQANARWWED